MLGQMWITERDRNTYRFQYTDSDHPIAGQSEKLNQSLITKKYNHGGTQDGN